MVFTDPVLAVGEIVLSVEVTGNEQVKEEQILQADNQYTFG